MTFSVPTVDITAYVRGGSQQEKEAVAKAIDEACTNVGFMQVIGHGIPEHITAGLTAAVDDFFALPLEAKKAYRVEGANRGYSAPKTESLSLSLGVEAATRMNDFFEAFNIGADTAAYPHVSLTDEDYAPNVWPTQTPGFEAATEAYFAEARRVTHTLTAIFTDALGLPESFFPEMCDHSIDVMRMNNYALPEGTVTLDGDLTGMGEHTDFGIVTVLWADQVAGLQVLGSDGAGKPSWHDVSPADGALLVNLGDLTARMTNDAWMSTLHRVKPPIVDGTIKRRRSVAFFHDGNVDAVVSTLPSHLGADDGLAYEPVTVRDHITAKLAGSRSGKANTAAVREAARVMAAAAAGPSST